jgi:hypothetical protein
VKTVSTFLDTNARVQQSTRIPIVVEVRSSVEEQPSRSSLLLRQGKVDDESANAFYWSLKEERGVVDDGSAIRSPSIEHVQAFDIGKLMLECDNALEPTPCNER